MASTTRKRTTTKAAAPAPEVDEKEPEFHPGDTRERELDYDVTVQEIYVEQRDKHGNVKHKWQPTGKMVPVLLIDSPQTFKDEHEMALRREPQIEVKREKVIRGALKKHAINGELYFEMGTNDAEMEKVIKYAIDLLKGYGVSARREIRYTPYTARHQW